MANTQYTEQIKNDVLFLLSNEVLDSKILSDKLSVPYPTMRRVIVELEEEGKVIKFDRRSRGARYSLAPNSGGPIAPIKVIPNIMFKGKSIPMTMLYLGQGIEDMTNAVGNAFLQAWTTIAVTGRRLHEGLPSDALVKRINRERVNLVQARSNLEQLLFMMNQVLDNEKLWDPVYLYNFPEDPDWESFLPHLEELYSHYFGEQNNG